MTIDRVVHCKEVVPGVVRLANPTTSRIAAKVINHLDDEMMKMIR